VHHVTAPHVTAHHVRSIHDRHKSDFTQTKLISNISLGVEIIVSKQVQTTLAHATTVSSSRGASTMLLQHGPRKCETIWLSGSESAPPRFTVVQTSNQQRRVERGEWGRGGPV
jgi:hypothetical protein